MVRWLKVHERPPSGTIELAWWGGGAVRERGFGSTDVSIRWPLCWVRLDSILQVVPERENTYRNHCISRLMLSGGNMVWVLGNAELLRSLIDMEKQQSLEKRR